MPIICSTVPAQRFEHFGVSFPEGWTVRFVMPPFTDENILAEGRDAEYLLVDSAHVCSAELIRAMPKLRLIHTEGVGFNKVDLQAAKAAGVYVCNNRAVNNVAVAEHTVGLMLAGLRRTALADHQIKTQGYLRTERAYLTQGEHELFGQRVGLIGFGAIGRETAARLNAFGCKICYYDAFRPEPEVEMSLNAEYLELDELLRSCDIISIHVPVLPTTEGMINATTLRMMKPNALLINTARGEIVVSEDLAEALEQGIIYGAALDTVAPEPMPDDHPLRKLSPEAAARLTLTPHVGGRTDEAFRRMLHGAIDNFVRVENGEAPDNFVTA